MNGLIREELSFGANPGAKDIARHLFTRMSCGKIVIVADNPSRLLMMLRKHWLRLARKVQRERSSTLDMERIRELNELIAQMHSLSFAASWPVDGYNPADVAIVTLAQLEAWPPECRTIYVTCAVELRRLYAITAAMQKGSLIVTCKIITQSPKV